MATSLYNTIEYPGSPFAQTHPERLKTIAALYGLQAPPLGGCRVLEIGCGDGGNLIPMAVTMPGATFVGLDLAESGIADGNRTIVALGLQNIRLHTEDIANVDASWGRFDYILAHGVYAWVPPAIQDHVLRVSRENLSPQGVAYVSYNALPGSRIRQMLHEMMLLHAGSYADPQERIEQAGRMLDFITSARSSPGPFQAAIAEEIRVIKAKKPWQFIHDDLTEHYHPAYFHGFMAAARSHSLDFLAEADFQDLSELRLTPAGVENLNSMAGDDRILREQYADFVNGRKFRQTLLVHGGRTPSTPTPERLLPLYVSTGARQTGPGQFELEGSGGLKTGDAWVIEIMEALVRASPQSVPVASVARSRQALEFLLHATYSGVTDLHPGLRPLVAAAGTEPVASSLARYQAARGARVTTQLHRNVSLDEEQRRLLVRLDGSVTVEESRAMVERFAKLGLLAG